jgi:acetylornithine deacetylase/succinyl-diaminopimelate desuccinylase-like protein
MSGTTFTDDLTQMLDRDYLANTTSELARVPTEVPLGFDTLIDPDHPKLVHYVQDVVRPRLVEIGAWNLIDAPLNNLIVTMGDASSGRSLLLINYTPAQHNNLMEDPFSGKIAVPTEYGVDGPAIFGQGVSQNKVHQAVMLTVLKLLIDNEVTLSGRLIWAVNNEGRSSHECSEVVLDTISDTPDFGIIQIPTEFAISLGNRGRIDIDVMVEGKVTHSSDPGSGLSAIDGAAEVVQRLKRLSWPDSHPQLGDRHALVYKIQYDPVAPHTIPSSARLTIDRRLLPGDDLEAAVAEVSETLKGMEPFEVTVSPGVHMLPALVDPNDQGVAMLRSAHTSTFGQAPVERYFAGTFDAAAMCNRGIPTVMYGGGGGVFPIGADFVTVEDAVREAEVLTRLVVDNLV